jgi:hypothetical protein
MFLGCDRRTLFRSHDSRGDCVAIPLRAIPRCGIPARLRFVIHSLIADEVDRCRGFRDIGSGLRGDWVSGLPAAADRTMSWRNDRDSRVFVFLHASTSH